MATAYRFYDVWVGLFNVDTLKGHAAYYVKARTQAEAERKALKEADVHWSPSSYGFELRVLRVNVG